MKLLKDKVFWDICSFLARPPSGLGHPHSRRF